MRVRVALVVAVVLDAGCYRPSLRDCTVQCSNARECGGGQICGSDGWCATPAAAGHCEQATRSDGAGEPPPLGDADDTACRAACTAGTCDHGVCVIDCSADSACPNDVVCPGTVPCRVVCGDSACAHHIECRTPRECEIDCIGTGSCAAGPAGAPSRARATGRASACAAPMPAPARRRVVARMRASRPPNARRTASPVKAARPPAPAISAERHVLRPLVIPRLLTPRCDKATLVLIGGRST